MNSRPLEELLVLITSEPSLQSQGNSLIVSFCKIQNKLHTSSIQYYRINMSIPNGKNRLILREYCTKWDQNLAGQISCLMFKSLDAAPFLSFAMNSIFCLQLSLADVSRLWHLQHHRFSNALQALLSLLHASTLGSLIQDLSWHTPFCNTVTPVSILL